jgi:hypothetical protein
MLINNLVSSYFFKLSRGVKQNLPQSHSFLVLLGCVFTSMFPEQPFWPSPLTSWFDVATWLCLNMIEFVSSSNF